MGVLLYAVGVVGFKNFVELCGMEGTAKERCI